MADSVTLTGLWIAAGDQTLIHGVDLTLTAGRCTALIGPSGAGKTLTSRALLGLIDFEPGVVAASLTLEIDGVRSDPWATALGAGRRARDRAFASVRGSGIGLLPQDARDALDPMRRVGWQIAHAGRDVDVADCLRRSGITDVERVASAWPHELSGGMARRVTIAQALAQRSRFLIVDEPTTGLDAVGVVDLCAELRRLVQAGLGLLLITHDNRILPALADDVLFLDGGRVVERLATADLSQATSELALRLAAATRRIQFPEPA